MCNWRHSARSSLCGVRLVLRWCGLYPSMVWVMYLGPQPAAAAPAVSWWSLFPPFRAVFGDQDPCIFLLLSPDRGCCVRGCSCAVAQK
jgi:hypothetical protein